MDWVNQNVAEIFQDLHAAARGRVIDFFADILLVDLCRIRAETYEKDFHALVKAVEDLKSELPERKKELAEAHEAYKVKKAELDRHIWVQDSRIPVEQLAPELQGIAPNVGRLEREVGPLRKKLEEAEARFNYVSFKLKELKEREKKGRAIVDSLKARQPPSAEDFPDLVLWLKENIN